MKTTLLYGKHGLEVEVPDHSLILEPKIFPDWRTRKQRYWKRSAIRSEAPLSASWLKAQTKWRS